MCPLGLAKVPSGIIYFEIEKVGHGEGGGTKKAERERKGDGKWRDILLYGFCMGS